MKTKRTLTGKEGDVTVYGLPRSEGVCEPVEVDRRQETLLKVSCNHRSERNEHRSLLRLQVGSCTSGENTNAISLEPLILEAMNTAHVDTMYCPKCVPSQVTTTERGHRATTVGALRVFNVSESSVAQSTVVFSVVHENPSSPGVYRKTHVNVPMTVKGCGPTMTLAGVTSLIRADGHQDNNLPGHYVSVLFIPSPVESEKYLKGSISSEAQERFRTVIPPVKRKPGWYFFDDNASTIEGLHVAYLGDYVSAFTVGIGKRVLGHVVHWAQRRQGSTGNPFL